MPSKIFRKKTAAAEEEMRMLPTLEKKSKEMVEKEDGRFDLVGRLAEMSMVDHVMEKIFWQFRPDELEGMCWVSQGWAAAVTPILERKRDQVRKHGCWKYSRFRALRTIPIFLGAKAIFALT